MDYDTSKIGENRIASEVDSFVQTIDFKRKPFERRWYDNNFFDDGYHFRFVSRTTGKIVDLTNTREVLGPNRSIPKASRQIRGVANLLTQAEPYPVIYPKSINPNMFPKVMNPETQKEEPSPEYKEAIKIAKEQAQNTGHWVTKEWERLALDQMIIQSIILAAKNSVAYVQVYSDPVKQEIKTGIYDAFDLYCNGWLNDLEMNPMVVKACPKLIAEIKSNKYFEEKAKKQINPDNRYASSEIKQAYMQSRYGKGEPSDFAATLILKEAYIKEYVNENNRDKINADLKERSQEFKSGDIIIRQVFSAGGVTLRDKYTALKYYPFVALTLEPGPLYQVPLIERFIPANKSLDSAMSRVERYLNTMVAGAWLKRKGETFEITNKAGGNLYEYEGAKPEQAQMAPIPNTMWNYINQLNEIIEEQGASTAALNQLPQGVKSGVAIEQVKSTEYANLKIASKQIQKFVKGITERMLDVAANNFVSPVKVERLNENGDPEQFDVIGEAGVQAREKIGEEVPLETSVIRNDTKVDIEVESALGFTEQGKRDTMMQIIDKMIQLMQVQAVSPEAVQIAVKEMLNTFAFGSTQEFMQAIQEGSPTMTDESSMKMKIAVLEALKDAGEIGQQGQDKRIQESKVATLEALKESGLADKMGQSQVVDNPEMAPLNYKDVPSDIKRQMEVQAGFQPSQTQDSPTEVDSAVKVMPPKSIDKTQN